MNTVYESLRTLLRNKEQEIKKLEKEIEALRVVLPIVAEAGESGAEAGPTFDSPRPAAEISKPKMSLSGPDFDSVMAQVKGAQVNAGSGAQARPAPIPESVPAKPRTSWP